MGNRSETGSSRGRQLLNAGLIATGLATSLLIAPHVSDVATDFIDRRQSSQDVQDIDDSVDLWTQTPVQIVFEREYDKKIEDEVNEHLNKLPVPLRNALGNKGYKVIMVQDNDAVMKKHGPSELTETGMIGGFTNTKMNVIVIDNAVNLPHELGHAVDDVFGMLSYSDEFMPAQTIEVFKETIRMQEFKKRNQDEHGMTTNEEVKKANQQMIDYAEGRLKLTQTFLTASRLPKVERTAILGENEEIFDFVIHLYVKGFLGYYYNDPQDFKNEAPEMYETFQKYDARLSRVFNSYTKKYGE